MDMLVIAILTAMDVELAPIVTELQLAGSGDDYVGELDDVRLVATVGGIGRDHAVAGLQRLHKEHKPNLIVSAGFAGGLDPFLKPGYSAAPARLVHESGDAIELAESPGERTLLTIDAPALSTEDKRLLRERFAADVVDMEAYHLARAAAELAVPLMVLRTISDTASDAIPRWATRLVTPEGRTRRFAAALTAMWHPRRIDPLLQLRRNANAAAKALGISVASNIARWVASH